ncbi:sensor domain-containing protein, partial [Mycobacterium saskatchewanense]|uniref:sensor domain-containing protein n=1 Tax=Mycobacterium saskatchewanense TaxID=220927 RepID=UPI001151C958
PAPWNQPPQRKRNPWPLVAAIAAVLVLVIGGVGAWFIFRPKPVPPPDPVPTDRLAALLLDPSEINSIMGGSSIEPGSPITSMDTSSATLSAPDCRAALYASQSTVYAGSGYTGVNDVVSREPGDNNDHWVDQAVVGFPTADKAKAFLQTSVDKWKGCAGKSVSVTNSNGKSYRWTLGQLEGAPPKISMTETQEGAEGWACQRVASVANNVIVDLKACGYHITDQGIQIADKIVGKIDKE